MRPGREPYDFDYLIAVTVITLIGIGAYTAAVFKIWGGCGAI